MKLALGVVLGLLACQPGEHRWKERKITTVEVGPFTGTIPAAWRDGSELTDKTDLPPVPSNMHVVFMEKPERPFQANIVMMWNDSKSFTTMPCDQVADEIGKRSDLKREGVASESTIDGDRLCEWDCSHPKARGHLRARFHADHILFEQCLRSLDGDEAADAGCTELWRALKLRS